MNFSIELGDGQIIDNATNNNEYQTATFSSDKMLDWHNLTTLLVHNINNTLSATTSANVNSTLAGDSVTGTSVAPGMDNGQDTGDFSMDIHKLVTVVVPICFGLIAVTGFFGNTLVILVVLFNQQMHSTTNLLIVNLAVADLLFVVFCIPFTAADYVTTYWPFGDLWCRSVQYLIVVTAFASIYTLVLMSVDRFLAVVHPIRSRQLRTENVTKIAIATLWVVILTVSAPVPLSHGVVSETYSELNVTFVMCQFMENEFITRTSYQIVFLASSYLVPLMVISGLYVRMIMRLWQQGNGVQMSVKSQRGRKRVTRLVVVVVVAFASLWLPVQLILIMKALGRYDTNTKFKVILQIAAQTLAYISSCINPVLYAFLSDNFRKAFYKAIHCSHRYQNYTSDLPPPRRTSCGRTSTTGL